MWGEGDYSGLAGRLAPAAAQLVEAVAPDPAERVLDLACGTGVVARLAAPHVGVTGHVTGLDLNAGMLAVARALPPPSGASITWIEGNAMAIDLPDVSFDVIVCQQGFQFFPDQPAALREMHRVLVPGGQVLLLDHIGSSWQPLYGAQWLVEQLTRRLAGEYQTRRQRTLVEAAGFVVEESERLKTGTVERIRASKPAGE